MPPIRTTVVGSYPVPEWLKSNNQPGTLQDAMRLVIEAQERIGIDVVSDGELSRWDLQRNRPSGMVERFVAAMAGIDDHFSVDELENYRAQSATQYRAKPPGVVVEEIGTGRLDLVGDYLLARELATRPLKFTITSPYMLASLLIDRIYNDRNQLAIALAEVLAAQAAKIPCEVLQIDEPRLPGYPEDAELAAQTANLILDRSPARSKAVHICFGNYNAQTIQAGSFAQLIGYMNALNCDHLVLEMTRRPESDLDALTDVDSRIAFGAGVIDVKDLQIETPEIVARRLERLAAKVGAERITFAHPDCGLQHLPREIADGKLTSLRKGVDLFQAGSVD